MQVRSTFRPPVPVTGRAVASRGDTRVTVVTGPLVLVSQVVVSFLSVAASDPIGRGVTSFTVNHRHDGTVTGLAIVEFWIFGTNRHVVSIRRVAFMTGDTTGGTFRRHDNALVTDITVNVLRCGKVVVIGLRISSPAGIGVTGLTAGDHRQIDVTLLTIGRNHRVVVLIAGGTFTPESRIVTSETIGLRIDAGMAITTGSHIASSKDVVIGLGIGCPAGIGVAALAIGHGRQVAVTFLTAWRLGPGQKIVVRLPWSIGVTAFAAGILSTGDGPVTGGTADLCAGDIVKADIFVVLQKRAAGRPEGRVVTSSTAIFRHQGVVTDRAIETLVNTDHVMVLIFCVAGTPTGRGVAIFAVVDIGVDTVTQTTIHTELNHQVVTIARLTFNVTTVTAAVKSDGGVTA